MSTLVMKRQTIKTKSIACVLAVISAIALPQIFHAVGVVSGIGGVSVGTAFLPMHIPVLLAGLAAGPVVGLIVGIGSPLISFALSGMPGIAMLPLMMLELCIYGLSAGLLRTVKMPTIGKVLIAQVAGRLIRAAAILVAVFAFGNETLRVASIWTSIAAGFPGLILQLTLIPLIAFRVEHLKKNER